MMRPYKETPNIRAAATVRVKLDPDQRRSVKGKELRRTPSAWLRMGWRRGRLLPLGGLRVGGLILALSLGRAWWAADAHALEGLGEAPVAGGAHALLPHLP